MTTPAPRGSLPSDTESTILVSPSTTPATVAALLRYAIMAVASVLAALGYTGWAGRISALLQAVGPVSMFLVAATGIWCAYRNAKIKAAVAPYVPDSVMRFK